MRLHHLQPDTPEWHEFRDTHKMASESAAVLECAPKWAGLRTPLDIWRSKIEGYVPQGNDYLEMLADVGHAREARALELLAEGTGRDFARHYVVEGEDSFGASPDGIDTDEGFKVSALAEVKSPRDGFGSSTGQALAECRLPEHYAIQVQHQLMVSGVPVVYFGVYDAERDQVRHLEVTPDSEAHARIREGWQALWPYVLDKTPPEPGPNDIVKRDDIEWAAAAERWKRAQDTATKARIAEAEAREALLRLSPQSSARGSGVALRRYWQSGAVDYKRVPQMTGVDTSEYRRPGSWRVRLAEAEA